MRYTGTMQTSSTTRGFTLVEMMGTIAIIVILMGVVLINYQDIKKKAYVKDAETTMNTARAAAALCVFRNSNLNQPNSTSRTCTNSTDNWPNIGLMAPGWSYNIADAADLDVSNREFTFSATDGETVISCDENSCETTTP